MRKVAKALSKKYAFCGNELTHSQRNFCNTSRTFVKEVAMRILKPALLAAMSLFVAPYAFCDIPADYIFKSGMDEPVEGPYTPQEAARFLQQATFGPKFADIERICKIGYNAWFDEQFSAVRSQHLPFLDALIAASPPDNIQVWQGERIESWFRNALNNPDQLRQRMAFALSEIFVISDQNGAIEGNPTTIAHYYDLLSANAFGNYRTLLNDVTLHPAMGVYLSMLKNQKPNATNNIRPDENYAREIMQLFSIGLNMLNNNGTPVLSGGQPVPSYTQDTIVGFAHVFTGWNYSTCEVPANTNELWKWQYCDTRGAGDPADWRSHRGWREAMKPWGEGSPIGEYYHSATDGPLPNGGKQLLNYPGVTLPNGILPGGGTARTNLAAALDNIARHPNVAPFISRLLIQRFVTSNPSPQYIDRVATVFNNNGVGVKGDFKAVLKAILLDSEARRPTAVNAGKVREPLLRLVALYRAFDANSRSNPPRIYEGWTDQWMAQAPMRSPTVFNFYLPNYQLPGEITNLGLYSPEFQITTDTYITRINNEFGRVYWQYQGNPGLPPISEWDPMLVNLERDAAVAGNGENLINRLNLLMMGGKMSTAMRGILAGHVNSMPNNTLDDRRYRVQDALWLILNSPEFVVEK
jgi:uncharacterized protein (DUF1800 family)